MKGSISTNDWTSKSENITCQRSSIKISCKIRAQVANNIAIRVSSFFFKKKRPLFALKCPIYFWLTNCFRLTHVPTYFIACMWNEMYGQVQTITYMTISYGTSNCTAYQKWYMYFSSPICGDEFPERWKWATNLSLSKFVIKHAKSLQYFLDFYFGGRNNFSCHFFLRISIPKNLLCFSKIFNLVLILEFIFQLVEFWYIFSCNLICHQHTKLDI